MLKDGETGPTKSAVPNRHTSLPFSDASESVGGQPGPGRFGRTGAVRAASFLTLASP
jgi:hypothetical protein